MPKRPCAQRAEWRLIPGRDAQRLSAHYRLDCDFGTPLITIFLESDGNEPVYLCEAHVSQVGRPNRKIADAAVIEAHAPEARARPNRKGKDRLKPAEVAAPRGEGVPPDAAAGPSDGALKAAATPVEDSKPVENPKEILAVTPGETPKEVPAARPSEAEASSQENAAAKSSESAKPDGFVVPAPAPAPEPRSARGAKSARAASEPAAKPPARDLTYGNSAKALVDEAIWNLPTGDYELYRLALQDGKPALVAAQAAGGQLAIVHRKIGEHTQRIEALLGESGARIATADVVHKPLEQAILEIIGSADLSDAARDAAMEQLGALEEWLNRGLTAEIAPVQAYRIACVIAERANWGVNSELAEELRPAHRAIYNGAKNAVAAAVPDALALVERVANLCAARAEQDAASRAASPQHPESVPATT